MKLKFLSLIAILSLTFGISFATTANAAVTPTFPTGCSSALGYSTYTGKPCNGTSVAINGVMPGCLNGLGFSITTGKPCSGNANVIFFVPGCTSAMGYSTNSGLPCNGSYPATMSHPLGCMSGIGYSLVNGVPCSGSNFVITFPIGCSDLNGFSTTTGKQCQLEVR